MQPDVQYPAFLITTAENDTRVHPMHALKMTAKLQNDSKPPTTLLWVERGTGHTNDMRKAKAISSVAQRMAFFDWQLRDRSAKS